MMQQHTNTHDTLRDLALKHEINPYGNLVRNGEAMRALLIENFGIRYIVDHNISHNDMELGALIASILQKE